MSVDRVSVKDNEFSKISKFEVGCYDITEISTRSGYRTYTVKPKYEGFPNIYVTSINEAYEIKIGMPKGGRAELYKVSNMIMKYEHVLKVVKEIKEYFEI